MQYLALLGLGLALAACSHPAPAQPDAAPPDAPDGVGCTVTTPRTTPVETFVGPTGLQARLDALIDSAQGSLDLHMYLFTVKELADRIVAAQQRGVAVRVILDPDEAGNQNVEPALTAGGVPWKTAATTYPYAHAKYLIVDHAQVAIMSMNFNTDAMQNERNYGMIDRDAEDIADAQRIFDYDWALAGGAQPAAPDLACTRLIVAPENAHARLLSFIKGATKTLDVETLYITDTTIRSAVAAAAAHGVTVRVILESPTDQASNQTTAAYLADAGIPVKYATSQFYLHAKLMIADGVAFVGSENFSPTSLGMNRELGALAFDPSAVPAIQSQFDADWAATTPAQ